jgi:hypothetical protein
MQLMRQKIELLKEELRKAIFILRNRVQVTQQDVRDFIKSHHPKLGDPKGLSTTGLNIKGKLEVLRSLNQEDRKLIEEFTMVKTPGRLRKLARVNKLQIGQSYQGENPDFILKAEKIGSSQSPSGLDRVSSVPKLPVLMSRTISFSNKGFRPVTSPFLNSIQSPLKKDGLADLDHIRHPSDQPSSALVLVQDDKETTPPEPIKAPPIEVTMDL